MNVQERFLNIGMTQVIEIVLAEYVFTTYHKASQHTKLLHFIVTILICFMTEVYFNRLTNTINTKTNKQNQMTHHCFH